GQRVTRSTCGGTDPISEDRDDYTGPQPRAGVRSPETALLPTRTPFIRETLVRTSALSIAAGVILSVSIAAAVRAEEPQMKTYTYKKVGDLPIKVDVYTKGERRARPVVVSIHGGALIMGHRAAMDQRLRDALVDRGYVWVSIDYRLAPETQLPEIIHDV